MTHLRFALVTVCAGVLPFGALACPTGADLDSVGIVFTVDGEPEVHSRAPNGFIVIDTAPDETGTSGRQVLAHGVHVLHLSDWLEGSLVEGSVWRFSFAEPVLSLPTPTPDKVWTVESTAFEGFFDGTVEVITHTWGPSEPYKIGGCSYSVIPVQATYDGDNYDHVEDLLYFPDLGTAILTRYSDSEGTDTYTYTDIRVQ